MTEDLKGLEKSVMLFIAPERKKATARNDTTKKKLLYVKCPIDGCPHLIIKNILCINVLI